MNRGKNILEKSEIPKFGRILLVKQDVHNDLYYKVSPANAEQIVYSSILRSGPVALFSALNADFLVVKTDPSPECNSWRQKVKDCRHQPQSYYENFQGKIRRYGIDFDHSEVALNVDDVSWNDYDIVISIDIAIPKRIVKANPQICWAYYVSEPCMPLYRKSLARPQFGYDLFFTLGFQESRPSYIGNRVLEFPYFLQYVGCFSDLDGYPNPTFEEREIVTVERHSFKDWSEEQINAVSSTSGEPKTDFGTVKALVTALRHSKFHVRSEGKAIWGNSLVEAAAVGTLIVASPILLKHRLVIPELRAESFDDILRLMKTLQFDQDFRNKCLKKQELMLNELCFLRPLRDLANVLENIGKGLVH